MTRLAVSLFFCLFAGACTGLPPAAYPVPSGELEEVHSAWVAAGYPRCETLDRAYILPADPIERARLCQQRHATCITSINTRPMHSELVAVVTPEYPAGWRHEIWHALEFCAWRVFDYGHEGPQWQAPRLTAGIP